MKQGQRAVEAGGGTATIYTALFIRPQYFSVIDIKIHRRENEKQNSVNKIVYVGVHVCNVSIYICILFRLFYISSLHFSLPLSLIVSRAHTLSFSFLA